MSNDILYNLCTSRDVCDVHIFKIYKNGEFSYSEIYDGEEQSYEEGCWKELSQNDIILRYENENPRCIKFSIFEKNILCFREKDCITYDRYFVFEQCPRKNKHADFIYNHCVFYDQSTSKKIPIEEGLNIIMEKRNNHFFEMDLNRSLVNFTRNINYPYSVLVKYNIPDIAYEKMQFSGGNIFVLNNLLTELLLRDFVIVNYTMDDLLVRVDNDYIHFTASSNKIKFYKFSILEKAYLLHEVDVCDSWYYIDQYNPCKYENKKRATEYFLEILRYGN